MPTFWLKTLGIGTPGSWLRDDWTEYDGNGLLESGVLKHKVMFPRRPRVEPGDRIVYYAAGWGLILAEGEATSYPYERSFSDLQREWPYWVNIRLAPDLSRDFIHDGVRLDALSVDGRDLPKLMRRRSHIRLRPKEYEAAIRVLGES